MPFTQRKLNPNDIPIYLARAERLKALGVPIEIPPEWRRQKRALFEVKVAGPPESVLCDLPDGSVRYAILLYLLAKRSGLFYPEFEIQTPWDEHIALESIDGEKPYVEFGGALYCIEDILNPQIEQRLTLPCDDPPKATSSPRAGIRFQPNMATKAPQIST